MRVISSSELSGSDLDVGWMMIICWSRPRADGTISQAEFRRLGRGVWRQRHQHQSPSPSMTAREIKTKGQKKYAAEPVLISPIRRELKSVLLTACCLVWYRWLRNACNCWSKCRFPSNKCEGMALGSQCQAYCSGGGEASKWASEKMTWERKVTWQFWGTVSLEVWARNIGCTDPFWHITWVVKGVGVNTRWSILVNWYTVSVNGRRSNRQ